jgi:surface adhesion protein
VTIIHNAAPTPAITNVENVNLNLNATGAAAVNASAMSGVTTLTVTRGDVTVGASLIAGNKTVALTGVDAADIGTIVAGAATTTVNVTQATTTGVTINADVASGNVTVAGAGTINAAGAGVGDTVQVTASAAGAVTTEAVENAKAVTVNTGAATVSLLNGGGGELFDGVIEITANSATTVGVANATGGLTLSATADNAQITASNIDSTGATITVGTGVATAGNSDIDLFLDGVAGGTGDVVTVEGAGPIDLDVNTAQLIETVNLSGTTAAVDYNMITSVPTVINLTGSQAVTVSNAGQSFNGITLTDSLTSGAATVAMNAAATGAVVATLVNADNFIMEADMGFDAGRELTVATGKTVTVAFDQTGFDVVGSAASATLNVATADDTAANGTAILIEFDDIVMSSNFTTVNIDGTVGAVDADSIILATTAALNLSGTKKL